MVIQFFVNNSDDTAVPKNLTQVTELTGTVKQALDILNPKILISSATPLTANYMYIREFGRYYFCSLTVEREGLYTATGHVDVIQSFWGQIQSCPVIVARSSNRFNTMLKDDERLFYQYTRHQYLNIMDIGKPDTVVIATVG